MGTEFSTANALPAVNEPSEAEVRLQSENISSSEIFINSERLRRFLRWTVDRTLAGETDQLKEYNLGRDVFDRGDDYDPRVDSIVRVEARRLRSKLHEYYERIGADDRILIEYRPGSYVPSFRRRPAKAASEKEVQPTTAEFYLDPRTVAVLPFSNLDPESRGDFFAAGIAEEILNKLSAFPELRIVARTSSFLFQDSPADVREIRRKLGAGTLVEGSVRREENNLRVSAKVIDARSGSYLWSAVFDRELEAVLAIQQEIAQAIAEKLRITVIGPPPAGRLSPDAVEAYTLYLRGRHHWNKLTAEDCRLAVEDFRRAMSLYPDFAPAYEGLADAYNWLIYFGGERPHDLAPKSRRHALEALRLEPNCAEAYVALGASTACYQHNWANGKALVKMGLDLRPSYVTGFVQNAFIDCQTGDLDSARSCVDSALRLDPLSIRAYRVKSLIEYLSRDYTASLVSLRHALTLDPDARHSLFMQGQVLIRMGRHEKAVKLLQQANKDEISYLRLGGLAEALAAFGRKTEALQIIERLKTSFDTTVVPSVAFVHAYVGLQDWPNALHWIEKACDEHWTGLMSLKLDPRYDALQSEPRFRAVLERMKLPAKDASMRTS